MPDLPGEHVLSTWTIYDHPKDQPHHYVVREWQVIRGQRDAIPAQAYLAPTLEIARRLIPAGLMCLHRRPEDDSVILETWI
jgi:hypothetical protein